MKYAPYRRNSAPRDEPSQSQDPFWRMGTLVITGSAVGGVLSVGLFVLVWVALPELRLLLAAALVVGGVIGLILWLRRR